MQIQYAINRVEIYNGKLDNNETLDFTKDTNVPENSYDKLAGFYGVKIQVT